MSKCLSPRCRGVKACVCLALREMAGLVTVLRDGKSQLNNTIISR